MGALRQQSNELARLQEENRQLRARPVQIQRRADGSLERAFVTPDEAASNACINHLRQIDGAIQDWALETKKGENAAVAYKDISPYLKGTLVCPAGGTTFADSYLITTVSERPGCKKGASATPPHVLPQL